MDQSYYHLRWGTPSLSGVRMSAAKKVERQMGMQQRKQKRNEDGWSRRSERKGFWMFKAFGFSATMHQESWFMCRFHMSHEEPYSAFYGSPNPRHNLSQEHVLPFRSSITPRSSPCLHSHWYNLLGNLFLPLHRQHPIYSHPLPVHLFSDTWPGVSMRGIL